MLRFIKKDDIEEVQLRDFMKLRFFQFLLRSQHIFLALLSQIRQSSSSTRGYSLISPPRVSLSPLHFHNISSI